MIQKIRELFLTIKQKMNKTWYMIIGAGTIVIVLIIVAIFQFINPGTTSKLTEKQVARLVHRVSRLIILPTDEQPVVFDVQDPVLLSIQQAFFNGSEQGDKLLIYRQTSRAIIYSPRRHIIVNVGPVNINNTQTSGITN